MESRAAGWVLSLFLFRTGSWEFSWFNKYLLSMVDWRPRSESGNPVWLLIGPRCTLRPRLKEELREE